MEWVEHLNQAIDYIEAHITEEIGYEQLGRVACCSAYHFQRMFAYMAGVPLGEYIRRRRMSLAAAELQSGDAKIIDVALKYGYSSPTAFNRAFQSVQGMPPSAVKKAGSAIKAYPPLHFKIVVKGVEEMQYRIEEKPSFRIVGVSRPLDREIEKNFAVVPQMWQTAAQDGTIPRLAGLMNGQPMGLLGVSACNETESWQYFIAVASTAPLPDAEQAGQAKLKDYQVPAATWAIFAGEGSNRSLQELEQRIVTEWLPTSGYEYANAPDIEVYLNPDPENARYEVWIPVKKAERG